MMYKSQYANRLPIGKKEILENFTHDKLERFYQDWYRPDLMSIIAVGDIDVNEIEKLIKDHFSAYKNPRKTRERKMFEVPNHSETLVSVESDPEASFTRVQMLYKDDGKPKVYKTIGDLREGLVKGLFSTMINNRLDELRNSSNPPFTFGYSYHGSTYARSKDAYQSFAMVSEDKQLDALKVLVTENERVKAFGFTQAELERAKTSLLTYAEREYNERDKTESENYVWDYQSHFLNQTPTPGIEWQYLTYQKLLPTITVHEVNVLINEYIKDENRVVIFTGPEKEGLIKPTETEVLNSLKVDISSLKPYEDRDLAESLLRNPVKAGNIVKKETNEKLKTTTLTLSNQAKVTYKITDFKNDEILFEGHSFGGSNLLSNEDYIKVQWALSGLTEAGFSGMDKNDINKFMTGKVARVNPSIGAVSESIRGSSAPKDLEYMMQMSYAYFTDLNYNEEAFEGYKTRQSAMLDNMISQPSMFFQQELFKFLFEGNPRFNGILPDSEAWKQTDYALAYQKYKERFANAGDFHFFFVGNIDEEKLEEFTKLYLASLPSTGIQEKAIDLGYRRKSGNFNKVIKKGKDPKSTVNVMYSGDCKYDPKEALALDALGEVLSIKLTEELRENESGVYGVGARGSMTKVPYGSYNFSISFPCAPENAETLTQSALRELQKIIDNGPEQKDLDKYKEAERLEYKENITKNNYWMSNFSRSFTNGNDPEDILTYIERLELVTAKDVQEVAKKYLTGDKVIATLMPEE
ncbi:MAG TPA: insulinase family protein [Flavobacterium sp.]|nr:insulinase family protein [Flavobacterium sp.]